MTTPTKHGPRSRKTYWEAYTDQPVQLEATPKEEIIVDRDDRDEEDSSDEDLTDESGADDPAATLHANGDVVVTQQDKYFGLQTNNNRFVFLTTRARTLRREGSQKKEEDKRANEQIARAEWARMAREEIEQREIDAKRLRIARETDYLRFRKAALVGGPMDVLDFFCALRPGRLYEQRVYVSAWRIQIWALIMVPCRYNNRIKASVHLRGLPEGCWPDCFSALSRRSSTT